MKAQVMLARLFAFLVVGLAATQAAAQENVVPTKGYVPDAATAEAIARAVLVTVPSSHCRVVDQFEVQ